MFRRPPARVRLLVGPALAALGCAGLVLGRLLVSGPAFDRMWAEDGKVFFAAANRLSSFAETYAGYAHTVPRLLAFVGRAVVPIGSWAAYAVLASCAVVGVLAAFVYAAAREVTGSTVTSTVAAASLALTPALMYESLGSLANLQWFLLAATLWALMVPQGRMRFSAPVVGCLTALSSPLVVLLLPAALLIHRSRVLRVRTVQAVLAGLVVQGLLIALGRSAQGGPVRHSGFPPAAGRKVFINVAGVEPAPDMLRWAVLAAVAVVLAVGAWSAGELRPHLAAAVGSGLLLLVATTWISGQVVSRYVALASMVLLVGVAIAVGVSRWTLPGLAVLAVAAWVAFPVHAYKFTGPSWHAGVAAWAQACAAGAPQADIPVSPGHWGVATITCPPRT